MSKIKRLNARCKINNIKPKYNRISLTDEQKNALDKVKKQWEAKIASEFWTEFWNKQKYIQKSEPAEIKE
jgi:hypothetical protein